MHIHVFIMHNVWSDQLTQKHLEVAIPSDALYQCKFSNSSYMYSDPYKGGLFTTHAFSLFPNIVFLSDSHYNSHLQD